MRRNGLFWGIVIIIAGFLFLLDNLKLLPVSAWSLIWPAFLILIGLWMLFGRTMTRGSQHEDKLSIPLEQATDADIQINHGAGRLTIASLPDSDQFLTGDFTGGVDHEITREGNRIHARLSASSDAFWGMPWMGGMSDGFNWQMKLSTKVALDLNLKTGASENRIDLTDLKVTNLNLETGASSTSIYLPAHSGYTKVSVHAGAASIDLIFPQNIAGKILVQSGLSGINVNNTRFLQTGNSYQSKDFDSAEDKVEIYIETGVGRISVA